MRIKKEIMFTLFVQEFTDTFVNKLAEHIHHREKEIEVQDCILSYHKRIHAGNWNRVLIPSGFCSC